MVVLTQRNFFGSGNAESIIRQDHEILDEGLREGDQAEFFRADHPEKIGEDQDRKNISDGLQDRK